MNSPHLTSFPSPVGLILRRPVLNSPFWKILSCPGLTPTSPFSGMTVTGAGGAGPVGCTEHSLRKRGAGDSNWEQIRIICLWSQEIQALRPRPLVQGERDLESSISIVSIIRVQLRSLKKKINPSFLATEQFAAFHARRGAQTSLDGTARSLVGSLIPRRISIQ